MGPGGAAIARAIASGPDCPVLTVDGQDRPMTVRAAAGTVPQRVTRSSPADTKPSLFPVTACEATLPARAHRADIAGRALPLPKTRPRRIVVIGDTGCRIKKSDAAYQACSDPAAYPFARVAASAAAWKPDLVIHVGDDLYRENACPEDQAGCAGSPWGYGWDAWDADYFTPGAALLRAAPWVLVRGNHENCDRAGQGWWRFLDPHPLELGRDCNDPANDVRGDTTDPYAVPLGRGAQIVVLDLATAPGQDFAPGDPRLARFQDTYAKMATLTARAADSFLVTHHPILGVAAREAKGALRIEPGNRGIASAFRTLNPLVLPPGVQATIAGHVHLWEQVSFSSAHPSQFIAGFSGTQEDVVPLPESLPPGAAPVEGAVIDAFSSWVNGFGFMTMERIGRHDWAITVLDVNGAVRNRCNLHGRRSRCDRPQVH